MVDSSVIFVDATHIKASANKKKSVKILAEAQALHYEVELFKEINEDRETHGKKPFNDKDEEIKLHKPEMLVMDGYKTPVIARMLIKDHVNPLFPYKRPMTKKGFFKKYEYVYDEYYDCYICPSNQMLKYSTTNQLSKKVFSLSERAYHTAFAIESVSSVMIKECDYYDDPEHSRIMMDKIIFCKVDHTPHHCQGYQLSLRNCGNYPITHMIISTTYPIGREKQKETLKKDKDILIQSGGLHRFLLCNTPKFQSDVSAVKFIISCTNIYGYSATMELERILIALEEASKSFFKNIKMNSENQS